MDYYTQLEIHADAKDGVLVWTLADRKGNVYARDIPDRGFAEYLCAAYNACNDAGFEKGELAGDFMGKQSDALYEAQEAIKSLCNSVSEAGEIFDDDSCCIEGVALLREYRAWEMDAKSQLSDAEKQGYWTRPKGGGAK